MTRRTVCKPHVFRLSLTDNAAGFIVPRNSPKEVASHLYDLWTDHDLYTRLSKFAIENVSDEVQTVGNALCWSYLASEMTKNVGDKKGKDAIRPNMRWINDLAREKAGVPYADGEPQLWRHLST
jgi:predicted metal-dependent peptidase